MRWMIRCGLVACLLLFAGLPCASAAAPPNIIFILADDLGWGDVTYAGAEFYETPNIDQLARQGMTFTDAYSGGANCAPSRACLMSGTYTPRHNIYTPGAHSKGDTRFMRLLVPARSRKDKELEARAEAEVVSISPLKPRFVCIPEVLKASGYVTARLGKWHIGRNTQGFDLSSGNGIGPPDDQFYGDVDVAEQLTDRAVQFIEENRHGPFFLYLSHWDVHVPHNARQDVVDRYQAKLDQLPESERKNFNPVYAGMVEAVDTSVARVVAKVDELGIADKTLIIFTSDNGGVYSVTEHTHLLGTKGSFHEAGIRVPTCMRWPGVIEPESTCDTPITSVDYLPTFAHLAQANLPESQPIDGVNITPLMLGKQIAERAIFWHYPLYLESHYGVEAGAIVREGPDGSICNWRAIPSSTMRRGDWKLIEYHEGNTMSLYNLKDDPGETNDLAEALPDKVSELLQELHKWQAETGATIPSTPNPECFLP